MYIHMHMYITFHCFGFLCNILHDVTFRCNAIDYIALRCVVLLYMSLHARNKCIYVCVSIHESMVQVS